VGVHTIRNGTRLTKYFNETRKETLSLKPNNPDTTLVLEVLGPALWGKFISGNARSPKQGISYFI